MTFLKIFFLNTIFVSSRMYPLYLENPKGTQAIVGSMNMGYISYTARNQTHNLFRPKREPIPLGHNADNLIYRIVSKDNSRGFFTSNGRLVWDQALLSGNWN